MSSSEVFDSAPLAPTPWLSMRLVIWLACVSVVVGVLGISAIDPNVRIAPESVTRIKPATTLLVFLAALLCEYIDSTLGMGYGTTLTPVLLLAGFEPMQIVPSVLLSEFLTGLAAGTLHHRDGNVDLLRDRTARRTMILLASMSLFGALAGVGVALRVSKYGLTVLIATIVLAIGIFILATVRRPLRYRASHIVALGGIAAFNKALSGGGYGPLVTGGQVVSGVSSKSAVAITCVAESFTCLIGLLAYFQAGGSLYWPMAAPMVGGALLSVPVATLTVRRMPERFLRGGVGLATCVLAILMFTKLLT